MKAELLRKLTIRGCGWSVADIKEAVSSVEEGESVELVKIVGQSTGAKTGQTDKGEYTLLIGDFTGVNAQTGEIYNSSKCILPNFISETLATALSKSSAVDFGLLIGAKNSPTSVTGYEFTVRPLIEAKPSDAMAALLAAAGVDVDTPALPAPEKAPKPAKRPGRPPSKKR